MTILRRSPARGLRLAGAVAVATAACMAYQPDLFAQQVSTVRSTNDPVWGHDVSLVEEVRIGRLNGPEEYVFGSIADLTVDAEGRIYVADGQVPIVRVYDADGRFVRNLGRRGAGPGEFRWISGVRMTPGGDLAVWVSSTSRTWSGIGYSRVVRAAERRSVVRSAQSCPGRAVADDDSQTWIALDEGRPGQGGRPDAKEVVTPARSEHDRARRFCSQVDRSSIRCGIRGPGRPGRAGAMAGAGRNVCPGSRLRLP